MRNTLMYNLSNHKTKNVIKIHIQTHTTSDVKDLNMKSKCLPKIFFSLYFFILTDIQPKESSQIVVVL